jgi:hypothetical protein
MDIEAEIRDLKRRVGELEGSFAFLTQQVRAVHVDLLGFHEEAKEQFKHLGQQINSLRQDLPDIIAGAVGDALRRH